MSSTAEHAEHSGDGHGPPTKEEHQKWNAEYKQNFLDQYRKQHNDTQVSAEDAWQVYLTAEQQWHAKLKELRHEHRQKHHQEHQQEHQQGHHQGHPQHQPQHGSPSGYFDETHTRINNELHQEFLDDFKATHAATNTIDAEQAWPLVDKVQHSRHAKWEAEQAKHRHKHQ
ncbi:unnamed protein product [Adineta steineri]|uniref:Uncharacterized protein n=1 Tax=Adineta steineri TaxID=433720 RepID=A0A815ML87_9BILA|nr:unnamed protein product [Adineta steineri]CAF3722800.1 unnamed protein product [Adineta steineri]